MALSTAELARLKYELGYHLIGNGAEPYIGVHALFEQVVQPYLSAGASTTCNTTVSAASVATPVALTIASATGFVTGDRVVIDVDDRQETATIQSLSGASMTVLLTKAHTGTYPVTVEGGEAIVRELLTRIREVRARMAQVEGFGGLKRADDIEWYEAGNRSAFAILNDNLMAWRDELASVLGVPNLWRRKQSAGSSLAVY
jgi:hypothetical protein